MHITVSMNTQHTYEKFPGHIDSTLHSRLTVPWNDSLLDQFGLRNSLPFGRFAKSVFCTVSFLSYKSIFYCRFDTTTLEQLSLTTVSSM